MKTVIIIGGGAAGAMLAAQIVEKDDARSQRVVLIERAKVFGRGAAYTSQPFPYLLNATVGAMSIRPEDPHDFLKFLQTRDPATQPSDFVTRERFGDYVEARIRHIAEQHPERLTLLQGEAMDVSRDENRATWRVSLQCGRQLYAETVVLATGCPAAAVPDIARESAGSLFSDPWNPHHTGPQARSVLILGSGLTMVDTVCALVAAEPERPIDVLSRRGLLPLDQSDLSPTPHADLTLQNHLAKSASLRAIARSVIAIGRQVARDGGDWRNVVTTVRQAAPSLWQRLSLDERRRFLRHLRPYWDIHRHRCPARVVRLLESLRSRGVLRIHAGRIDALRRDERGIEALYRPRGSERLERLHVDRAFNCIGPDYDLKNAADALWSALLERGVAVQDALRLGVETDERGALIDAAGESVTGLYCFGPLRRARLWEVTAIAELRTDAARLAAHIQG